MEKIKYFFKTLFELLKKTFEEWKADKASRLAAGLAYYTIFALAPTVLVILSLVGLFIDRAEVAKLLTSQVGQLVGGSGSEFFQAIVDVALEPKENNLIATIIGIVVAIVGATGVFVQLKDAINTVWGINEQRFKGLVGLVRVRAISLTGILVIGFMLLVSLLFSTALNAMLERFNLAGDTSFLLSLLGNLVSLGMITVIFALMYKFLPDAEVKWRDVWMGAFFTAFMFMLGNFAIGKYLGMSNLGDTYGVAGSVLVLLTWIYYSAQILLFGAEFTQVYSNKLGTRSLSLADPMDGAKGSVSQGLAMEESKVPFAVLDEEAKEKQGFWRLIGGAIVAPLILLRILKPKDK